MRYNPFAYIHSEQDILKLVTALIANTKGEGRAGDDFWVKAETLLYTALIAYIHYEAPIENQNFSALIDMLGTMEVREEDESFQNNVDYLFEELEREQPSHFAVRQYRKFKLAAGKTLKSILVSCGARMAPFDIAELREVTAYDEMELDTLGDRKTALFLIISDTDDTFNFLVSLWYTQLFNLLWCAVSSTKQPISDRFPSWKSSWPPSAPGKSRPVWYCRHSLSLKPYIKTMPIPSPATACAQKPPAHNKNGGAVTTGYRL